MQLDKEETNTYSLQEQVKNLFESHEELTLYERLEVVANYFIQLGVPAMRSSGDLSAVEDLNAVMELVNKEKQEYGETLATALTTQGMVILMWLEQLLEQDAEEVE